MPRTLGAPRPPGESPGGCNAGIKMQARRLRYGRPPPTAALAAHDRHPDRGRDGAFDCAAPPSEPYVRISRIRLSSQRVPLGDRSARCLATPNEKHPGPLRGLPHAPRMAEPPASGRDTRHHRPGGRAFVQPGFRQSVPSCVLPFRIRFPAALRSNRFHGLLRYYGGSDCCPGRGIPSLSRSSSPCLTSRHLPDIPTPTIQHRTGVAFQLVPFQRAGLPVPELSCRTQALFGTRGRASSHARRLASMFDRITFVSFGLSVRLPLLPTPPRGDAVTVGYMLEPIHGEDLHLSDDVRSQAH
jgi:hypothetical protein